MTGPTPDPDAHGRITWHFGRAEVAALLSVCRHLGEEGDRWAKEACAALSSATEWGKSGRLLVTATPDTLTLLDEALKEIRECVRRRDPEGWKERRIAALHRQGLR